MPVKLPCPRCARQIPLEEPLPLPGDSVMCSQCGSALAVTYPPGVIERLRAKGKRFSNTPWAAPPVPAEVANTDVDPGSEAPTVAQTPVPAPPSEDATEATVPQTRPTPELTPAAWRLPPDADSDEAPKPRGRPLAPRTKAKAIPAPPPSQPVRALGCFGGSAFVLASAAAFGALLIVVMGLGTTWLYGSDLPTVDTLRAYEPPAVTVVYDKDGKLLGEIFDQRRYVVTLDEIPKHVQDAFIAAEDANFWNHGGIDFIGIVRAMGRNLAAGRMAQGASTITQQVARNFLLDRDKKLARKIKEVLLSWRIEEAYEKEHILFLYLNEIFLGSQAYGVEAASRAYYGKSVRDISVAEAAVLAGLPQRPSDYSPHRGWDKARARQEYVIGQMVDKGFISRQEGDAALAEHITIVPRESVFLANAPHFTEHVRRQLVETYGEERVLRGGLQVTTSCDLELQQLAQRAITEHVTEADMHLGFRRDGLKTVPAGEIAAWRSTQETNLKQAWADDQDPSGRVPIPDVSPLADGQTYDAIALEVQPKWIRFAIGAHEGVAPIGWADWAYAPDPARSWRYRTATDFTAQADGDGDGKNDGPLIRKGDILRMRVEGTDSRDAKFTKVMTQTPGATDALVAGRLWQDAEVEGALLAMDVTTGAITAMVGGVDFKESQLNRATQSRRQVGSTFKPIVYAAAINSRKITAATLVADAPLAFATNDDFVWKPQNYSGDYLGNLTLRQALAASKNTCTVRVLETIDPGMNGDVVYKFARGLGLGGPALSDLPTGHIAKPDNDILCPWVKEKHDSTVCMDRFPPKSDDLTNTAHRAKIGPNDVFMCRACDFSMGLGSASLTLEEMVRAYGAFPSGGNLVEPWTIASVRDRHGSILKERREFERTPVMDPGVATIGTWLMQSVVQAGTGADAYAKLGLVGMAGKTGTTNDEKDAWFVGFTNDTIAAVWVGYDQPRSLGISTTGGRTALPAWIDFMREAAPKSKDRPFPIRGDLEWLLIDENTGRRVNSGGMAYPFLTGTAPESTGLHAGQATLEDIATEL